MKKLVDTCGWIEWLTNGKLAHAFESYLLHTDSLITPTLIQFELYKWVCREKNANIALEVIGMTENTTIIELDTGIALFAADISKEYGLAMADAIIYATARKNDALLVTADKHFKTLPHVKFFEK
jgi:predicted nucleic acid-binding protein